MKILRRATVLVFIAVFWLYLVFTYLERTKTDRTYPIIQVPPEVLELSITATEADLLTGVTAYDEKDGDLTREVLVESISQFTGDSTCIVTYAVADNDCHVAKATRTLRYTDYTAPRFYLNRPLVFAVDEKVDIKSIVGAVDCIDGDISDRVTVVATDYASTTAGVFTLSLQATNSRGHMIYLDLPIYVEQNNKLAPQIELSENLIYAEVGQEFDFETFIEDVTLNGSPMQGWKMLLSSNHNSSKPGIYNIHYYVSNEDGYEGHSILTVVVEE